MKKVIVDSNVILGFLVRNDKLFVEALAKYEELVIPNQVIFEVEYVLSKQYGMKRQEIVMTLMRLLQEEKIQCERILMVNSLLKYRDSMQLSLVDCYLLELGERMKCEVLTLDKQLGK